MAQFTREQEMEIIEKAMSASNIGDQERKINLLKQLPLSPHIAKAVKEIWGKKFLIENGFNLSNAEAEYGNNWLNK